jgi:Lsr2
MAKQATVRFVDDLDGSEASGTFDFSLEGRNYQVDLSDQNAANCATLWHLHRRRSVRLVAAGRGRTQRQTARRTSLCSRTAKTLLRSASGLGPTGRR